jgi:hypothetical protein
MRPKSEPTTAQTGAKAAAKGKVKIRKLQLNKDVVRDLNARDSEMLKGGIGAVPPNLCSKIYTGCKS